MTNFGELVTVAFENQRDKLSSSLDILMILMNGIRNADAEVHMENEAAPLTTKQRAMM
jgi:hypothetical protein